MVCAFMPLFTMQGPEGQIFGPMADTYAFALGGALLLALTCRRCCACCSSSNLKPARDNFLVRWLQAQLPAAAGAAACDHRWATLAVFGVLVGGHGLALLPYLGREFMPELEEGNLWIRGTFPVNVSLDEAATRRRRGPRRSCARTPRSSRSSSQIGRPDDGTDPTGFYNVEFFVPLKPQKEWPGASSRRRAGGAGFGGTAAAHQGGAGRRDERRAEPRPARRGLELLAEHPRQRHGGAVRRQGRQLGQDHRPRPRRAGATGREGQGRAATRAAASRTSASSASRASRTWSSASTARSASAGASASPTCKNVIKTAVGGKAVHADDRGREDASTSPCAGRSSCAASEQAILDIPVDVTNNQVTPGTCRRRRRRR